MPSILIVGKGAREYAIRDKLESHKIFMIENKQELNIIINCDNIDLIIIGSEKYLVEGIVDDLNIPTFGPSKKAAQIEGSKIFAKEFMKANNIPTAEFNIFTNYDDLIDFFKTNNCQNYVIKQDGLAGGKGVYLPNKLDEIPAINKPVVVEERLYGQEVSVMAFCNGHDLELMPQIKDYKRINDNNEGKNTGGMGAIGPVNILNELELRALKEHMLKVVTVLKFKGVLYAGVMKTEKGFYILEFNCRFGDPETQVALNLLKSDLYDICMSTIRGKDMIIEWHNNYCANVVLSHIDYPNKKLDRATKITTNSLEKNIKLYWANPVLYTNDIYTYGGRVVSVVNSANNLYTCLTNIYNNIHKINYEGRYYRRDIGLDYLLSHTNKRKLKIGIISSSRGTSIKPLLEKKDIKVEVIISNKLSSILDKAREKNIAHIYLPMTTKKEYYSKLANILMSFDLDLIFAVGYMNIFPADFCQSFEGKIFNIHPSLLPDHKGLCGDKVHQAVLDRRDGFSGCTLHHITPGIDEGKIVLQKQCRIVEKEDITSLKKKVQDLEAQTIIDFIRIQQNNIITYKDAGVDINKGDDFVNKIKDENIGSFCAVHKIGDMFLGASTDGVGTKLELANQYHKLDNIGFDLVAMCVNDLIVRGIRPKFFLDYIAMNKLNNDKLLTVITSIKAACQAAGCLLLGGETAEMPGLYRDQCLDLAGFSVGVLDNQLYPKIEEIESGCRIYGLKSNGLHSNGYSLVRKLLKYHAYDIDTLLKPTKIYMECFDIMSKYQDNLLGLAHITGGGLIDNIKRIIPAKLTIKINVNIENEFEWVMEKSGMKYEEMITTFNCGYGIALIFKKGFEINDFNYIGDVL
jgi:phosphoribosylamine--glycine ligase/phosphoribosylaminoimidazole synthetase